MISFILIEITFVIQIAWIVGITHVKQAACPNCRTELIAFFVDETDDARIIEANTFIPNGSQVQSELINSPCQE